MENYEEKYEEALKVIKKIKAANKDNVALVDFIEYNYPELKEDRDEGLRQMLIQIVNITPATIAWQNRKELLDWLEKHKDLSEEERDEMLNNIIQDAKAKLMLMPKQIDFLKTIRLQPQQYHWKPTAEQLGGLLEIEGILRNTSHFILANRIAKLYEELKNL